LYCEKLVVRQQRRVARTHVGEDDPANFLTRVCQVADFLPVSAAPGLARLLEHSAAHIVEPAVIQASEPAVFDPAIAQISAPMRAMQADQAEPSLIVAEQHQLFPEYFHF